MRDFGTIRQQGVRVVVALGIAGLLLLAVFFLGGQSARAGIAPHAGFMDAPAAPAVPPQAAEAATWNEFRPTGWITQSLVSASVSVTDSDGLQDTTAQYSYSTDGGGSWFSWGQTGLTVSGDLTTTKRMTVTNLFLPDSATNNLIMFRILDGAAMTETSPAYPLAVDSTAPSSLVLTNGWFKTLSVITGTASDATSGVARVDVLIQRGDNGQYYNGSGWQTNPLWLLATGTTNWSYPFAPTETVTYTVSSRATDQAGLVQSALGTGTIYFDNTPPTSAVGTSGYYRTATWTGFITGTASDVGSGVQKVEITLKRLNDELYYDGSGWVGSAVWLPASGTTAWSYAFAPTPGMTYEVRSRATDNVGNVQTAPSAAATFMLDTGLPTSSVGTSGYYGTLTWTGNITGTASDAESGVARVDITIQRQDGGTTYYYNGSWWQTTEIWLLASGTANWHYPFTPEHGRTYTIRSRAQDLAGNQQIAYGTGTLIYDSGAPTSSVTTSGLLGKTAWTGTIAGLASDDFAGVDVVHITVRRPDGQYYTGSGWVTSTTWLTTSGTTAWTYAFTPTQGLTYTVQSRATDRAGNMQTTFGSAAFSYDGTDPTSTVGVSGYYGPATWTGAITGTAADGESGLQSVVLSIKKSDNTFWNGTAWQAIEVWLPATGTANWSYPFAPQHGETYTVRAKATDRAGNEQATPSQSTFTYDAASPVSAITTSGFYRLETWPGQIDGTASDEGVGLQRVELTIQRPDNRYYNGTGWQDTEVWLAATGTDAWQYAFAPTDGMTYTVRSRALDAAGNVQAVYATSSFCYDLQPPDSQVGTGGYYNALTWTGAITGTATDATSGVLGVAIILQRSVAPHYWNGTIWQAAQTWITATGSVTWSYPFAPDSGVVYTVTSRAVDKAGNTEITYGTGSFALDLQEPDSVVGTSGFYRPATWTGAITGTASAGVSGVARVEITVQRSTDEKYYNGTGWQLASQWLTATGTLNWTYPFSPTESVTYTVQSRAWSVSGVPEVTYGTGQFIYDSAPPTATLTTSAAYRTATWPGAIAGLAADAGVGVDFVDFTLQRSSDNKYFAGGSAWANSPVWLRATGAETWGYTFTPPVEAIYTVQMRPTDKAGNVKDPPTPATFILDNTAPYAPTEPQYYDGWKNTNVFTVTWTNAPDLSGIAGAYYKFTPPTSPTDAVRFVSTTNAITDISVPAEGMWDLHLWLQDNAGNVNHNRRLVWPAMFKYDATPPQTTHALVGPAGTNGWFLGTITATLTVTDQPGLSGVSQRFYQVDGGAWLTTTASFLMSGDGVHTFSYYATDNAGNIEPTHTYTVGIDTAAPSVTHTLSGTLSATGWYTSPVTVILDGTDATSGVDDTGYRYRMGTIGPWLSGKTFVVGGEGTRTFYYYAIDRAGNQSDIMSGTVQVDTVPPTSSIQISGAVGDNGWYRSSVGVTISVTDTTSGPAEGEVYYRLDGGPWVKGNTVGISTDGDHVLEHYGVDVAGNRGVPVESPVRVDTTAPGMPMDLTPSPTAWTNVNRFSISWTPPADTSGIAGAYYKLDAEPLFNTDGTYVPGGTRIDDIAVSGEGRHSITVWLRDMAGNVSFVNRAARINAFLYDPLPPTTNAYLGGVLGNNGWFTSPVTVTLVSQDQAGLSGVAGVAHRVDGSAWVTETGVATAATVVSVPGKHVVEYRGLDAAGNVETVRSLTVRVDNRPPAAPTDVRVTPSGWSRGSTFTVTWKNPVPADDSGIVAMYYKLNSPPSGPTDGTRIAIIAPSAAINVTANGEHDLYVWLEDEAGNVGYQNYAWLPKAIRRDALPPTVTHALVGTLGSENWYISPVTVTLTATDTLSGLAAVRYRVDGGAWQVGTSVAVSADGDHTVAYKATDVAGNESSVITVSFRIDRTAPFVSFIPTGSFQTSTSFTISWAGTDPSPGSGLARYDVQVADGLTGAWVDWLTNTDQTSAPYVGQRAHTYGFRARARDLAGNQGDYPPSAQILVQVSPIVNGDLEAGNFNGWNLGCTPTFNRSVVRAADYRGVEGWVARLGDPAYTRMDTLPSVPVGAACMSQTFAVPPASQMLTPVLSFWYHIYTYDVVVGSDGRLYDSFDVTITRQGGSPQLVLRDGNFTEPITSVLVLRDLGWRYAQIDLSPYAGQTITVEFANWNREYDYDPNVGLGWYNTWTLVDLVQVRTRLSPKAYLPAAMVNFDGTRTVRSLQLAEDRAVQVYPDIPIGEGAPGH
ncbi:MAG: hypothetical protein Kow00123_02260 [Anaerolineales bacterium]